MNQPMAIAITLTRAALRTFSTLLLASSGCAGAVAVGAGGGAGFAATPVTHDGGDAHARAEASMSVDVRVDFFGIPLDRADDVVFVLDRSGSMDLVATGFAGGQVGMGAFGSTAAAIGGTIVNGMAGEPLPSKLEAAKQELLDTLDHMPDGTRFDVVFFDDDIAALSRSLMVLSPATRAHVAAFVRAIKPGGSTAAVPALDLAYSIGARRIVLLSDGLANNGGGRDDLMARARPQIARGVRFDTVGIGLDQDADLLQALAADSGGMAVMR
jgi:hypothetical protein